MTLYLSRLRQLRNPSMEAMKSLLQPDDPAARLDANHRLIWSAFAGDADAPRDFLWRAEGKGRFYVLSRRIPVAGGFFAEPETKPFAPALAAGDRLRFLLRANATRARSRDGKPSERVDIVMDALFAQGGGVDRRALRMPLARREATAWMQRQGAQSGFQLALDEDGEPALTVADYSVLSLSRGSRAKRRSQPHFGILDLSGAITLTDPDLFLTRLAMGFGRAKSFGCGLMMIRPDDPPA
jgi:CRISPR system Cascade subunit CasE